MAQYRRLSAEHIATIQKSLLQSQLESLTAVKHIREYNKLRHEELLLKIKTKELLDHLKQEVNVLLKGLPEPVFEREDENLGKTSKVIERSALEDELDAIKAKLAQLQ